MMLQWHTTRGHRCVFVCTEEEDEDAALDSSAWCLYKTQNNQDSLIFLALCARLPGCYLLLFNNVQTHCSAGMRCLQVSLLSVTLTEKPRLETDIWLVWATISALTANTSCMREARQHNVLFSLSYNLFFSTSFQRIFLLHILVAPGG